MIALLCAAFGLLIGMVFGAATQRWGDADRATHGHKVVIDGMDNDACPHCGNYPGSRRWHLAHD